jgi:hypothetical protein
MVMLEAAAVIGLVALLVFAGVLLLIGRTKEHGAAVGPGSWRAAHYDAKGVTRVVVQKISATGVNKLDEHVVAELRRDDPDYDERFLEAMNTARQRQSLFEAEES